jgi:hypothetical protein
MKEFPFQGPCMCRGILSDWDREYPFIRQGVMHSPVGCLRRELKDWELKNLYKEMTGFVYQGSDEFKILFQVVMGHMSQNLEVSKRFPVTLSPVPTLPPFEKPSPQENNGEGGKVGGVKASRKTGVKYVTRDVVVNPGPIKPPWIKD